MPVTQIFADHALLIYIVFTAVFLCIVVALSAALGPRRVGAARGRSMSLPYESGIMQTGSARLRLPAQYYLLAVFFVIFDVEGVFLYAWATVTRQLGWGAFIAITSFVVFLALALVYLWRSGALEWGPDLRRAPVRLPPNTPAELVTISKHEV